MSNTALLTIFRGNIIQALRNTSSDEELRKELHKLVSKEVDKEVPVLLKKDKKKETIH